MRPVAVERAGLEEQHVLPHKREFKPPWREAGPPNHHDEKVDSDQEVVNKTLSPAAQKWRGGLGQRLENRPSVRQGSQCFRCPATILGIQPRVG